MTDYTSANITDNVTEFKNSITNDNIITSLHVLPGQSNYSILLDSMIHKTPSYDIIKQKSVPDFKAKKYNTVTQFYLGALTVVGLLIVYRLTYSRSKM